jgi:hypothetical protein
MTPLSSQQALEAYFLEARCRLLDLAAILDRVDRGSEAQGAANDPRLQKIQAGIEALLKNPMGRAEAVQQVFSLPYDPSWPRPSPR